MSDYQKEMSVAFAFALAEAIEAKKIAEEAEVNASASQQEAYMLWSQLPQVADSIEFLGYPGNIEA